MERTDLNFEEWCELMEQCVGYHVEENEKEEYRSLYQDVCKEYEEYLAECNERDEYPLTLQEYCEGDFCSED